MRSNLKKAGNPPYKVALIHGGPGASGEMVPVTEELSKTVGVIEPYQTAYSINGQINELKNSICECSNSPITLAGFSWGAWLSMMVAARYPKLVKKLILISTPPLTSQYSKQIQNIRLNRLSAESKKNIENISNRLFRSTDIEKQKLFIEMGKIFEESDTFKDNLSQKPEINYSVAIFQSVWKEAAKLRDRGTLLEIAKQIKCPTILIHGEYDPHPLIGAAEPLLEIIPNLQINSLEKCGHKPWIEKYAKENFYNTLLDAIAT